jgi:hypothetical protein
MTVAARRPVVPPGGGVARACAVCRAARGVSRAAHGAEVPS